MVQLTLTLDTITSKEAKAVIAMLQTLDGAVVVAPAATGPKHTVTVCPVTLPTVEDAKVPVDPTSDGATQQSKTPETGTTTASEATTPTPASVGEAPTADQLREALKTLAAKSGMTAGIALLKTEFGCARITELAEKPVDVQLAFLARCNG